MFDWLREFLMTPTAATAATVAVALLVVWMVATGLRRGLASRIEDSHARYRVRKVIGVVAWVATALIVASQFSERLGGLTVAFGVAGAGIAFALQEVIASIAGWFALQFGGFYRVGDRVQLGGIKGDVIDIGVLRTTLMEMGEWVAADQYSGRIVRVANSFVFKEPVFNYSGDFPFLWEDLEVPVRYGSDYERMRELLLTATSEVTADFADEARGTWAQMLGKYAIEPATVDPMVTIVANDNWVRFTVRYVVHYRRRRTTKDALFRRILKEVEASDGAIRLASATFELTQLPPLELRLGPPAAPTSEVRMG